MNTRPEKFGDHPYSSDTDMQGLEYGTESNQGLFGIMYLKLGACYKLVSVFP